MVQGPLGGWWESALLVGSGRRGGELGAVVLEGNGHLAQLGLVGVAVVGAEQQLAAGAGSRGCRPGRRIGHSGRRPSSEGARQELTSRRPLFSCLGRGSYRVQQPIIGSSFPYLHRLGSLCADMTSFACCATVDPSHSTDTAATGHDLHHGVSSPVRTDPYGAGRWSTGTQPAIVGAVRRPRRVRPAGSLGPVTQTLHARSDGEFEPDAYTARHLLVLEGLEAVRKRPGMYIGSTDSRGLMHCLWEIIDNAVDEALGGHCTRIEVDAARRRLGRGARRRPRHPGRRRAARPGWPASRSS